MLSSDRIAEIRARYASLDAGLSALGTINDEDTVRALVVELMNAAKTVPMLLDEVERLRRELEKTRGQ